MHTHQNLDNLIFAVRQNVPHEPSWCINFSRKDRLSNTSLGTFQIDYRAKEGMRAALGRGRFQVRHDVDNSTLALKGIMIGRITTTVLIAVPAPSEEASESIEDYQVMLAQVHRLLYAIQAGS
jgi:hypothetical protein